MPGVEVPWNPLQSGARIQMRNERVWIKLKTETMKMRASGYLASQWIKYNIQLELEAEGEEVFIINILKIEVEEIG